MYKEDHDSRSVPAGALLEVFVSIDVAVMNDLVSSKKATAAVTIIIGSHQCRCRYFRVANILEYAHEQISTVVSMTLKKSKPDFDTPTIVAEAGNKCIS